jgi:hypothetical protein
MPTLTNRTATWTKADIKRLIPEEMIFKKHRRTNQEIERKQKKSEVKQTGKQTNK